MLKIKRLLTDEEFEKFRDLRENKGDKQAAKYVASLKDELYEEVEDNKNNKTYGDKKSK